MTSRPLVILGVIIILFAIVAAVGYLVNGQKVLVLAPDASESAPVGSVSNAGNEPASASSTASAVPPAIAPAFYQSTSTPDTLAADNGLTSESNPISQPVVSGSTASTTPDVPFPASTTVSTASWIGYTDPADGYSYEHPSDLTQNVLNGDAAFSFPKNDYFHWPLLDSAMVTVAVSPSCPQVVNAGAGGAFSKTSAPFLIGNYQFTRSVGTDVGAGERTLEVAYDTKAGGQCYHIDFIDRGANGAGFYVDDASLIATYDAQHAADLGSVIAALNGVVDSFRILAASH